VGSFKIKILRKTLPLFFNKYIVLTPRERFKITGQILNPLFKNYFAWQAFKKRRVISNLSFFNFKNIKILPNNPSKIKV